MQKMTEILKFEIIQNLKSTETKDQTVDNLLNQVNMQYDTNINRATFYQWLKKFDIPFKSLKPKTTQTIKIEQLEKQNHIIFNALKELYNQLGIEIPKGLKNKRIKA